MKDYIQLRKFPVKDMLKLLLTDKTTGKNITFATNSYADYGINFAEDSYITETEILGIAECEIQPRICKALEQQAIRTKNKAEVFTPSWICNRMNNFCDEEWFGEKNIFNSENGTKWTANPEKIRFVEKNTWQKYVDLRFLEITCGECPYLVSRYDTSTGDEIPISERIGILDRKLRVVGENTDNEEEWLKWVTRAYQSTYGYEYQGDSLLIARINLLMTFCDYMQYKWNRKPKISELNKIVNIISWNIFQMNGINGNLPIYGLDNYEQMTIFSLTEEEPQKEEIPCYIYNWRVKEKIKFNDTKEGKKMKFDFVIGNPPYQEEAESPNSKSNAQKPRTNIFQYFQEQADVVCGNSCMIYPGGRWIHQSGKGLKNFGKSQINDSHLVRIVFYPKSKEVFPAVDIPDGISIVLKNKNKTSSGFEYVYVYSGKEEIVKRNNPGDELMPLNPKDGSIIKKISDFVDDNSLTYLHDAILPRSLFAIESTFAEQNPDKVHLLKDGEKINPQKEIKLFTNDKSGAGGRSMWFIADRDVIKQNQKYISEWQVVVSSAHPGGQDGRDNQLAIIDNMSAFGRARVALRSFKTKQEAENFFIYIKSNFVKYAFLMTDEALSSVAKKVPDFNDYSDNQVLINFHKDIDSQMYKLLGLTQQEIDFIETKVKEMN